MASVRRASIVASLALHGVVAVVLVVVSAPGRGPSSDDHVARSVIALSTGVPAPIAQPTAPVAPPPARAHAPAPRPQTRRARPRVVRSPAIAAAGVTALAPNPGTASPSLAPAPGPPPTAAMPPAAMPSAAMPPAAVPTAAPAETSRNATGETGITPPTTSRGGGDRGRAGGPGAGGPGGSGLGGRGGTGLDRASAAPPPRVSKARPARLIWPKRTAETDQGTLVVLILSVDHDGFVTGVRLKGGSPRRRDEQAADAAWKFRYDPARDHDGRPIASKVDQPVVVL
jgi:hypothetical protein